MICFLSFCALVDTPAMIYAEPELLFILVFMPKQEYSNCLHIRYFVLGSENYLETI